MANLRNLFGNLSGTFISDSGIFHHDGGIVHSFTPNPHNRIPGGIDGPDGWGDGVRHYDNAIRTLIVPDGIVGFADDFLRGWAVTEAVVFPESLLSVGQDSGCAFANCYLPEIVLPASLSFLAPYAFGQCYIKRLVIPPTVKSKYARQFKDSTIEELRVSKDVFEQQDTSIENDDYGFYRNFHVHCRCNIIADS